MNLQEVKRIWGHASWAVFAVTCLILSTIGTVANGRTTLICAGLGIIIAIWMHAIWAQKMSSTPWMMLKGVAAIVAVTSSTIAMWGFIEKLPVKDNSMFFTVLHWVEYGIGTLLWLSGVVVLVYMAWHLLRLVVTKSLQ